MKRKKFFKCIAGALLLGLLLAGCGSEEKVNTSSASDASSSEGVSQDTETDSAQEQSAEESNEPAELEDITINTPYGDLHYPEQWTEFIKTDQKEEEDSVIVTFEAEINGTVYPLFEVTIGKENGTAVGELTDADGVKRTVYMKAGELSEDPLLTEDEQNRLYAMQEDLNYVIDHLE